MSAAETAKTIKKTFNKEQNIVFDDNLLEVDLSEWSGLKIDEIKKKFPEIYLIWKNDPENLILKRNNNKTYKPIQELFFFEILSIEKEAFSILIFLKPCLGFPNNKSIKHLRIALCPTTKIFASSLSR